MKKDRIFLDLILYSDGKIHAHNIRYFMKPKDLDLPHVEIHRKVIKTNDHWKIELSPDKLAKNVFLSVKGDDGFFQDNFFDMIPGETKVVKYFSGDKNIDLSKTLVIQTLVDTFCK